MKQARTAADQRLTEAQARLVADHWRWARRIAASFAGRYPAAGVDWEGEAAIAICRVAMRWDPLGTATFRTCMTSRVRWACLDAIRMRGIKGYRRKDGGAVPAVLSLDDPVIVEGWPTTHAELVPSEDLPTGWEVDSEDAVIGMTAELPERHRDFLRAYFLRADASTLGHAARSVRMRAEAAIVARDDAFCWMRRALGA